MGIKFFCGGIGSGGRIFLDGFLKYWLSRNGLGNSKTMH